MATPPSVISSVVKGWVLDEVPDEEVQSHCLNWVDTWKTSADQSSVVLWLGMASILRRWGCYDAEVELCRLALSMDADLIVIRLRLAEGLFQIGEISEAREILKSTTSPTIARINALNLILRIEGETSEHTDSYVDELEPLLLERDKWDGLQNTLARLFISRNEGQRAANFIDAWTKRWPLVAENIIDIASLAMLTGNPSKARAIFKSIWPKSGDDLEAILGKYPETIAPFDNALESDLLRRISEAFDTADSDLAVLPPPKHGAVPTDIMVMFVSFGHRKLPNDFAEHMANSAAEAGVSLDLYLDTALSLPDEFRGSDQEVHRRIAVFSDHVAKTKPAVIILDCCMALGLRGLNPAIMADLKEQHGFRLVSLMRDAHSYALPGLRAWLPACDSMFIGDPHSPILEYDRAPPGGKVIILPLPALHSHFLERRERGRDLVFIGSVNVFTRLAYLSVLATEDIRFKSIIGNNRSAARLDTQAYARELNEAGAILNISAHTPTEHLITGRVWEAFAAGALLVEQENESTASFFTPYRHYLPWKSVEDIVHITHFMDRHPDIVRRIADEGHAWARRHYGVEQFWNALLAHALRPTDGRDVDAELRSAREWYNVSVG
jgi:hypothetical protein